MVRTLLGWIVLSSALAIPAQASARQAITLAAPLEKAAALQEEPGGRLRVATVRALPKSERVREWNSVANAFVAQFDAASASAEGLRVQLDVSKISHAIEVRVKGSDGRVEVLTVHPGRASAWTPWTEGELQTVEITSAAPQPIEVIALLHFTHSPFAKVAGSCTVPVSCSTSNAALDAAIAQAKRSVMKIQFVEGGGGFVCSATLIDTPRRPAPYVLTANHCIGYPDVAPTINSFWFYENSACDTASFPAAGMIQLNGGMEFVFGNHNVDSTLMLMSQPPPANAVYTEIDAQRIPAGTQITSISHPSGDTARLALGAVEQELRLVGRPQDMYAVRFTRGIIEGGSSGSGIFTLAGSRLNLRGVLSASTIRNGGGMSCSNVDEYALYGRMEIFHPQMEQYIRTAAQAADDAPNRHLDVVPASGELALDQRPGQQISLDNRRLDYAGDLDLYRFVLSAPAVVSAWTEGNNGANLDTVGNILDADGANVEANDDEQVRDNHFGLSTRLEAGTYYVQVGHFDARGTGSYNLRIRADAVDERNHTALWWNPAEPGWGLNVNHQGNKVFATLFTYDTGGQPTWLVMSDGARQADGTYEGTLYRATGPAFNASPFGAVSLSAAGTMRLGFFGENAVTLIYTFNGVQVTKQLSRQEFGPVASCTWSAFDRSFSANYQDLWYNPSEPGWGVNITHQGSTVFATLFTYDASGRDVWLVMSNGANTGTGFSGPLYRTSGPAFNASPWTPATNTQVGTMTFDPPSLDDPVPTATLTYTFNGVTVSKRVQRQVFGSLRPDCG